MLTHQEYAIVAMVCVLLALQNIIVTLV